MKQLEKLYHSLAVGHEIGWKKVKVKKSVNVTYFLFGHSRIILNKITLWGKLQFHSLPVWNMIKAACMSNVTHSLLVKNEMCDFKKTVQSHLHAVTRCHVRGYLADESDKWLTPCWFYDDKPVRQDVSPTS